MEIVQISSGARHGGASLCMNRLSGCEISFGHKSTIFVGRKEDVGENIFGLDGFVSIRGFNRFIRIFGLRNLFVAPTDLFLKDEYKSSDVVVLHNIHGGFFRIENLVRLTREKPVVWVFHDMWPICGNTPHTFDDDWWAVDKGVKPKPKNILDRIMFERKKKVYAKSNFHIVVPSMWLYKLVKRSILKDFPITLIHNGIDSDVIKPLNRKVELRKKYGIPKGKKVISFISHGGITNPWKGGEYMMKVLDKVKKDYDVLFLEIGARGSEIVKNDNHWTIPFIHERDVLNEYLNISDLFLFTSVAENFPLVLLEAQSAGVPVVTFDVGGSKEIVKHMETGYVARYKDVDDVVKGVKIIQNSAKLQSTMSKNARQRVLENFTLEDQGRKYIEVYNRVIDQFKNRI